jgi:type IV pilus assembly protein PilB
MGRNRPPEVTTREARGNLARWVDVLPDFVFASDALAYHGDIVPKRIGELLVEGGVLSQSQLEQALFAQRKDGRKLGQLLIELGLVSEIQLTQTLSRQLSVPWVSLYHVDFSRSLLNLVSREIAERYAVVPILVRRVRKQGDTLYVAMDDPTNDAAIDEVARTAALPVKPMIACPSDIRAAIRVYYLGESPASSPQAPSPRPMLKEAKPIAPAGDGGRGPAEAPEAPEKAGANATPPEIDSADAAPEIHSRVEEIVAPKRRPKMISLTLLDGTTVSIPAPSEKRQPSKPDIETPARRDELSDQLTARDLVSALRAVAHGVDASEILGTEPRWEAMFSALLSILLRKGLIADWEFVEEFRKL